MTEDQFLSLLDRKTADLMLIGGRFKRGAFEAIHAAATALHNDFLITNKTMQQFNAVCIGKSKTLKPQDIKKIRKGMNVSRTLFSECLNVSRATVAQWERGEKYPTGAALRLLFVVEKHGIQVLS